ncbi:MULTISPECIES: hypothetical protein [Brochothrix]|uniref:hypothetical protein n=1 Tax=Brochothrix TaxID=2755 RepID=UPI000A1AB4DD|nr:MULTISPECIES: hypothetical protein [Brochothrix]MBR5525719.1 hypothetical protein [Brochothrix sp.]WKK68939.1 hypothetical protein Q0G00_11755 [Brochothrix thermosphacta]SLM93794.1 hypothetical protein FM106_06945 [Brachybacterium faecium]
MKNFTSVFITLIILLLTWFLIPRVYQIYGIIAAPFIGYFLTKAIDNNSEK